METEIDVLQNTQALIQIAKEAVENNFWPMFEVENGVYKINKKPKDRAPIVDWLKQQVRFKHLFKPGNEGIIEEIQTWDIAAGFGNCNLPKHSMPTLDDVLDVTEAPISVDLKPDAVTAVDTLIEVVEAHGAEKRITVGSFHGHLVHRLRRLGYRGSTALTRGEVAALRLLPTALARQIVRGQAAMIPTSKGSTRLDGRRFIHRCRALGLRVDFWVVNDPGTACLLLGRGATGIITDDPRTIAPVMREFSDDRQT